MTPDDERSYTPHFEPEITRRDVAVMLATITTVVTGLVAAMVFLILKAVS
jgi:hypothetical protein